MLLVAGWVVLGLIAGLIAMYIMPGRDRSGAAFTLFLSLVGSILGGFLGRVLFYWGGRAGSGGVLTEPAPFLELSLAVGGALLALAIYRFRASKRMRV
ncbi:MAG TPA: hypothetical protein VF507_06215 [Pyrinomonadaceae bacterium]